MLSDEVGVLGQSALFEHVAQLLLAPAPARLGGIAQRIAEPRGFGPNRFLADAHRFNLSGELPKGIDPLLLQRPDLLLVALEPLVDRREQRLEPLGAFLLALGEALLRAFEQRLLRLAENLRAEMLALPCSRRVGGRLPLRRM